MTFDDDFVRLLIKGETYRLKLVTLGLTWPPPDRIRLKSPPFDEADFQRIRMSSITDEQRSKMTHVCRGAEYAHVLSSSDIVEIVSSNVLPRGSH